MIELVLLWAAINALFIAGKVIGWAIGPTIDAEAESYRIVTVDYEERLAA